MPDGPPLAHIYRGNWAALGETPLLTARNVKQKGDMDGGTLRFVSTTQFPFVVGQNLSSYANCTGLFVDDIDNIDRGDGVWEHDCQVSGIVNGSSRRVVGFPQVKESLEDWDTAEDEYITSNKNHFRQGILGSYGGTTVCTNATSVPVNRSNTLYRVRGSFKGIISPKSYRRTITCNGRVISADNLRVLLENGWSQPAPSNVALPTIVITDTYFSTTPPPTGIVPSSQIPPNTPPVRSIFFTNLQARLQWPNPWSFTTTSRQIPGVSLWEKDLIYELSPRTVPA